MILWFCGLASYLTFLIFNPRNNQVSFKNLPLRWKCNIYRVNGSSVSECLWADKKLNRLYKGQIHYNLRWTLEQWKLVWMLMLVRNRGWDVESYVSTRTWNSRWLPTLSIKIYCSHFIGGHILFLRLPALWEIYYVCYVEAGWANIRLNDCL